MVISFEIEYFKKRQFHLSLENTSTGYLTIVTIYLDFQMTRKGSFKSMIWSNLVVYKIDKIQFSPISFLISLNLLKGIE